MSQKAAVLMMGIDKAQYIRQLDADGHLSIRRLGLLGQDFWLALIDELREHFKLNDDAERLRAARELRAKCDAVIDELAARGVTR